MKLPETNDHGGTRQTPQLPGSDITGEVWEWVKAMAELRKRKRFPADTDVYKLLISLGYRKHTPEGSE